MAASLVSGAERRSRSKAMCSSLLAITMDVECTANAKRERRRPTQTRASEIDARASVCSPEGGGDVRPTKDLLGSSSSWSRCKRELRTGTREWTSRRSKIQGAENLPSSGYRVCRRPVRGNPRRELREYPGGFTRGNGRSRFQISRCRTTLWHGRVQ